MPLKEMGTLLGSLTDKVMAMAQPPFCTLIVLVMIEYI